jgi:biotin carboxyl carrier protein
VLDVGQGGNAQVPTIEELRDAYRMVRGDIGQRLDRIRAAYRKGLRRLKRAVAPVKQAQQQANPKTGPRKAPKAPTPKAPKAPRASKSGKAPRPVRKVASRDITISGKINGRNATTTISRGQKYRVERQGNDVHLVMPGLFGKFIVNPGDVGKL